MRANRVAPQALPRLRQRWGAVVGLLLLAPIAAEYLIGYDQGIGRPWELLAGLLILSPLYGAPAVLIREVTRRTGRGWPTILLLATALGVVQAGLIDQSLFHLEFDADDPAWATQQPTTPIPGLGIDAGNLLNFVGGHVIWSFAAPIAVVESCVPRLANRPWLGRPGLVVMVMLYLFGAVIIFSDIQNATITTAQMIGAATVALVLITGAFAIPREAAPALGQAPSWWVAGAASLVLLSIYQLVPVNWAWPGVALTVLALGLLGGLLLVWSRRRGWGRLQVLAVAGAALLLRGGLSFLVEPLGDVSYPVKYVVNTAILVGVVSLLMLAYRRLHAWDGSHQAQLDPDPRDTSHLPTGGK